jgi:hypothetical protein
MTATIEQLLLLPSEPADVGHGLALLIWRIDPPTDRWIHVRINGDHHTSERAEVGELWLHLDRRVAADVLVVVTDSPDPPAVDPAPVQLLRNPAMPVDTQITIAIDGEPLQSEPLWSPTDHRMGFGGQFGDSDFGRDGATAPGHGLAGLGVGPHGFGDQLYRYTPDPGTLAPGEHELGITLTTPDGRMLAETAPVAVAVDQPIGQPRDLRIDPDWTLRFTA